MEASVLKFWRDYVNSLPPGLHCQKMQADVFAFGDSRKMADQLAMLVREGVKTATCSALWSYEEEQNPLPQIGNHSVVLDGNGVPVAVIETVDAFVVPFNEVPEWFAYDEGQDVVRQALESPDLPLYGLCQRKSLVDTHCSNCLR
jgi:hypothetical protein